MHLKVLEKFSKNIFTIKRSMTLFTQVLNPITGVNQWDTKNDDYDYHQEVANAGFGDMLHDWERNQKYYAALKKTIAKIHSEGREAHVLDIGTGTGILSMMAVSAGADSVTACEAFLPMANCAERILEANGMSKKIQLVKKRSTDLVIGVDLPNRANLLVTEVLDTELIGEGAIGIYNHAHKELLTNDVVCIPSLANCWAQIVESPLASQWNTMKIVANLDGDVLLRPPIAIDKCNGSAVSLHDVQLSQLPLELFRPLTNPIQIFQFEFNRKQPHELTRCSNITVRSINGGSTDLVFYWWDIKMDLEGEIRLSCAPYWAHPDFSELSRKKAAHIPLSNVIPWRDHWMQAIYYIPRSLHLPAADSEFTLSCNHDEYSLWFDVTDSKCVKNDSKPIPRHSCTCDLHTTYARSRIGQINQTLRNKRYMHYLEDNIDKDSHVLVIGDGCLLGLSAAKLGAASVYCYEPQSFSRRFMQSVAEENKIDNVQFVEKLDDFSASFLGKLTHIFAEPYFLTSILPWDNFYYGTLLQKIRNQLPTSIRIAPHSARIVMVPVEFLDLHKIRTSLGTCEGFGLTLFDQMVNISMTLTQAKVEAQPLWEYPCRALALPQQILSVNFTTFTEQIKNSGIVDIHFPGSCNGVALWVDWCLNDTANSKSVISTGPVLPIEPGTFIKWDMFSRQGVHFIPKAPKVLPQQNQIHWNTEFKPDIGEIKFNFEVHDMELRKIST